MEILSAVGVGVVACAKYLKDEVCAYWDSLDENTVVNKQDLVLGGAALVAAGLLVGKLCASKKQVIITVPEEVEEEPEEATQE